MSDTVMSTADLLDELAALKPAQRRKVATQLKNVLETFAEVPDVTGRQNRVVLIRSSPSCPRPESEKTHISEASGEDTLSCAVQPVEAPHKPTVQPSVRGKK